MKTIKISFSIALCLILNNLLYAQQLAPIGIGQQCPNIMLTMVNDKNATVNLSDVKGKLLILDFWATWCGPCRGFLERADSLNKQFDGLAQIIPVSDENRMKVLAYLNDLYRVKGLKISSAVEDKELSMLFPHTYIPHEVWIDLESHGKVIAITDAYQVNALNINKVLDHQIITLNEKVDGRLLNVDYGKPLLLGNQNLTIPDSLILFNIENDKYHAILTKTIPGLHSGESQGKLFFTATNAIIANLFTDVTSSFDMDFLYGHRTICYVNNETRTKILEPAQRDSALNWEQSPNHLLCFELLLKDSTLAPKKFQLATEILNNYYTKALNIKADMKDLPIEHFALIRTSNDDGKLKSKGREEKVEINRYGVHEANGSILSMVNKLEYFFQNRGALVNETGIKFLIDVDLNCDLNNTDALNKELAKYDLKIVKKSTPIPYVVINQVNQ